MSPAEKPRAGATFAFGLAAVMLCLFRLVLQLRLPVFGRPASIEDDMLMASYADAIRKGEWLGAYSERALEKFPGHGVFLAFADWLGIPYMLALGIFWVLAAVVFLAAMRRWRAGRWVSLAAFSVVLFSPVMLQTHAQRLYLMASVPPTILLLVSSFMVQAAPGAPRFRWEKWLYAGLASLSAGYYAVLRQDAIWVLALLALLFLVFAFQGFWDFLRDGRRVRSLALCLVRAALPLAAYAAASLSLSAANYARYGVWMKSDFTEGGFARACLSLMSIRPDEERPLVYVSESTIRKAFAESPALRRLEARYDERREKRPIGMMANREWEREFYAWQLRWSAASAGVYAKGAPYADGYFRQVADEIDAAVREGRLAKRDAVLLSPFTGPLTGTRFWRIVRHSLKCGLMHTVTYRGLRPVFAVAKINGGRDEAHLSVMEDIAHAAIPSSRDGRSAAFRNSRYRAGVACGEKVSRLYQATGAAVAVAALAVFSAGWLCLLFARSCRGDRSLWCIMLFSTAMLAASWMVAFIVSANFFELFPDSTNIAYTAGAVPPWHVFCACTLLLLAPDLVRRLAASGLFARLRTVLARTTSGRA